jgi:hypothetical protein
MPVDNSGRPFETHGDSVAVLLREPASNRTPEEGMREAITVSKGPCHPECGPFETPVGFADRLLREPVVERGDSGNKESPDGRSALEGVVLVRAPGSG